MQSTLVVSYWSTTAEGITLGLLVGELWINKYAYTEGEDFFQGARMSLGNLGERWEFQEKSIIPNREKTGDKILL